MRKQQQSIPDTSRRVPFTGILAPSASSAANQLQTALTQGTASQKRRGEGILSLPKRSGKSNEDVQAAVTHLQYHYGHAPADREALLHDIVRDFVIQRMPKQRGCKPAIELCSPTRWEKKRADIAFIKTVQDLSDHYSIHGYIEEETWKRVAQREHTLPSKHRNHRDWGTKPKTPGAHKTAYSRLPESWRKSSSEASLSLNNTITMHLPSWTSRT